MGDFRESGAVIREAELLASTAEAAAGWIRQRSTQSAYVWTDGDPATELALLGIGSRLVDLALARYGRNPEVLRELYGREDGPLRTAVLANEPHLREVIFDPWVITGASRDDFSWLAGLSDTEFQALFANPALPDSFISDFFEQKGAWGFIGEDRRREAIHWLTRNLAARDRKDFWDGWADYSYNKVFDAAWRLSADVPTTAQWAATFAGLYDGLPARAFSKFDPLEIARRWFPPEDDQEPWNDEQSHQDKGHLTYFQRVRCGLARLAASRSTKTPQVDLLSDTDVAVRCGALRALQVDADGIADAIERDGAVAADALIENERVWRKEDTRDALREACWALPDPNSTMLIPEAFNRREAAMRERYPRWFADEDCPPEDASEVSLPSDVAQLRQQLGQVQKQVQETRFLVLFGLIAAIGAYFMR